MNRKKKFLVDFPHLVKEIHPSLNKGIDINTISYGSNSKLWWVCSKNHTYQKQVRFRVRASACPYCSGRSLCEENSLLMKHPKIASQWHPELNGDLRPNQFFSNSKTKIWWKCARGHNFQSQIVSRTNSNHGHSCPYCFGNFSCKDNSLYFCNRPLAKEWHPKLNVNLKPKDVTAKSRKKVWWLCKEGHSWQARISNRAQGSGCPTCHPRGQCCRNIKIFIKDTNLVSEWDFGKNFNIDLNQITHSSAKTVWWKCLRFGHSWQAKVGNRYNLKSKCPVCSRIDRNEFISGAFVQM